MTTNPDPNPNPNPNPDPNPNQVYQENVYGGAKFASFKRALGRLRDAAARGDAAAAETVARTQLVSFHSTSKGFFAECHGQVESAVLVVPLRTALASRG